MKRVPLIQFPKGTKWQYQAWVLLIVVAMRKPNIRQDTQNSLLHESSTVKTIAEISIGYEKLKKLFPDQLTASSFLVSDNQAKKAFKHPAQVGLSPLTRLAWLFELKGDQ